MQRALIAVPVVEVQAVLNAMRDDGVAGAEINDRKIRLIPKGPHTLGGGVVRSMAHRSQCRIHRNRDLVATPKWQRPRRVVEPSIGLSDGLDTVVLQCLRELAGTGGYGLRAAVAAKSQHRYGFGWHGDQADLIVGGRGKSLHRPLRRHEEPDNPAAVGTWGLDDGCGHRDLLATPCRLLADGRCHRNRLLTAIVAEDVTHQPAEADVAGAVFVIDDRSLGGDSRTVAAYLDIARQLMPRVLRFLRTYPDADHRGDGFNDLLDELGESDQRDHCPSASVEKPDMAGQHRRERTPHRVQGERRGAGALYGSRTAGQVGAARGESRRHYR